MITPYAVFIVLFVAITIWLFLRDILRCAAQKETEDICVVRAKLFELAVLAKAYGDEVHVSCALPLSEKERQAHEALNKVVAEVLGE